jgi:hypothetical protein
MDWREKLKFYLRRKDIPLSTKKWNAYLKEANEFIETYKDISAIMKFLGGFSYPDLTAPHFLNFLELLEVPKEDQREIILGILSERFGAPVKEEHVLKARALKESFLDYLKRKKEELRGKTYKLGIGDMIRREVNRVKKPDRLVAELGEEVIPYLVRLYLSEDYLNLFGGKDD